MGGKLIAHVRLDPSGTRDAPHALLDHLQNTAKLAEKFAAKFHSEDWGKAVGMAHDAGKARAVWQKYLCVKSGYGEDAHMEEKQGKIPHAIHGAKLVELEFGKGIGRFMAYCIAGHHAGLQDWLNSEGTGQASLQFQMNQVKDLHEIDQTIVNLIRSGRPGLPPWKFEPGLDLSLWIRMLYSCLVDADFLDTEQYMDKEKSDNRGNYLSMSELLDRLREYNRQLDEVSADSTVNEIRRKIRSKCISKANEPQGIFSLTVPTGGGKTLSSLAFALEHAVKHNLDHIIYVIPYTSIIEQNAEIFRAVVGHDQVIEHHSNIEDEKHSVKSRLAAENWDAPVIVTTSVQFFESLFAAKSSRCRKLHNIAKSVVILDEAQLVPVEFLAPILETMQLLVDHYRVSFVISTATQPAFKKPTVGGQKFQGLRQIREIMGDEGDVHLLYQSLKRCKIEFPNNLDKVLEWNEIADHLKQYEQVLCVVSDRNSCRELHRLMPEGTYHLSALMCGQHRSDVIAEIKQKLKANESVRVISTQLVEAGVDLDFSVVFRALAGLDSIAQAAGRCNREGKMTIGRVIVFVAPKRAPLGILRKATETTIGMLSVGEIDLSSHEIFEHYFSELYWKANSLDAKDILPLLDPYHNGLKDCSIYFRTAADKFQIIDSLQKTILIPYGDGATLIEKLRTWGPDRGLMRKLQRYSVNIYNYDFNQILKRGSIEEVYSGIFALKSPLDYSRNTGLLIDGNYDPEEFIL